MDRLAAAQGQSLCIYRYDPLDRVSSLDTSALTGHRFYRESKVASFVQQDLAATLLQTELGLLGVVIKREQQVEQLLFATNEQNSVFQAINPLRTEHLRYTPYGYHVQALSMLPAFVGECPEPVTGYYMLGNGYRAYNPILMRFHSPDSMSPFGGGGINAYAYCAGDPLNRIDLDGHSYMLHKAVEKFLALIKRQPRHAAISPRITGLAPIAAKPFKPRRLIANLNDSAPLPAIPETVVARTADEMYFLDAPAQELLKHHRRYVKSSKQMLSEKRRAINKNAVSQLPNVKQSETWGAGGRRRATNPEELQLKIAEARRQAGRVESISRLGRASDIRKEHAI
ncbi:RHS repeat-associated core domain-containing protein [Pseudomonas sp. 21LCFQ010]|uniref:RHS repeat-associated core domain-containing protein n=1 Tax=Pseudomonas sp. 21LCFQ010 TaxID=2957506 RepID=UPI002096C35A|nr:RHS repeat-associated core domain-containing protein [Pseudomonas sp. 21LCFQ010]MCO8160992.1 RHS repeat-associated core domain-containing protein [Pseudomonas sp. 21LCFQ010]